MPVCLPNRDTLSGWQHPRKPCPRLSAQNGTRFPDGMPSGKRIPESRPRTGHAFRLNAQRKLHPGIDAQTGIHFPLRADPETVSHSERQFWDELSARGFSRKRHPTLKQNFGTQFPFEAPTGKRVPLWSRIPGRSFRSKQKAPAHDGAGAKGAAYTVDGKRRRQSAMAVRALLYPR